MKTVLITQSNYIPWKGYFDAIRASDVVVLYDDVQFTRRDWRNRNRIKTPQGVQWITIPVEVKGKYHQKISETCISDTGWRTRHWRTLEMNYRRAPCFEWCQDVVRPLYERACTRLLSEVNYLFLVQLAQILGCKTEFRWSADFVPEPDRNERLIQICRSLGATTYLSGPSARAYLDEPRFAACGVSVKFLDFSGYPAYPQQFGAFDHHVTLLDLLFNTGKEALQYMKKI